MKVTCKGNTLTMYSSFCKTKTGRLDNSQKFVKYGKHTFKLTSKTKYWSYKYTDGNEKYYFTKAKFMSSVKRFNGLGLWIKVKDEKSCRNVLTFIIYNVKRTAALIVWQSSFKFTML